MHLPEDVILFYPNSLDEANAILVNHPEAIIISTVSKLLELDEPQAKGSIVIDLSQVNELNFFMEDHGLWFIGASIDIDELSEITLERIPGLSSILLQYDLDGETSSEWLKHSNGNLHISDQTGMKIEKIADYLLEKSIQPLGIPCMISIPKH